MKRSARRPILAVLFVCVTLPAAQAGTSPTSKVVRGWLSDEGCARGRASSGVYTGTNPDCAKRCVAQGRRIVLIVHGEKKILDITNQDAARGNIGDEVQVTGTIDAGTKGLHIESLKMLSPGRAMCGLPAGRK